MIDKNNTCLLLTGCIAPSENMINLVIRNNNLRYKQYIDCIKYYIDNTDFDKIVFCENSNYRIEEDLVSYGESRGKEVELLSFFGDFEKSCKYGKGYGESEIINHAINNSKIIRKISGGFIKITGRLKIHNLNKFKKLSNNNVNGYFDFSIKDKLVDTRCFWMNSDIYKNLFFDAYKYVNEKENITYERVIFNIINNQDFNSFSQLPFPINYDGFSGSLGTEYKKNNRLKLFIKSIIYLVKTIKYKKYISTKK